MIIVKLQGGLGNQLFQYSLGKSLELSENRKVYFDVSSFNHSPNLTSREFVLEKLGLKVDLLPKNVASIITFINRLLFKLNITFKSNFFSISYCENSFQYIPIVVKNKLIIFDGYWQSPMYFESISNDLTKLFYSIDRISNSGQNLISNLKSKSTVAIHIRRGDYISNTETYDFHGICDLDYYYSAIDFIESKNNIDTYIIFTDDIEWVQNNFSIGNRIFIYGCNYAENDIDEFLMMASVSHNIIANSTFSWWSAFINPNPEKIVIAPKKWFSDLSINVEDLFPTNWVRL
jgi:hypothetical protein